MLVFVDVQGGTILLFCRNTANKRQEHFITHYNDVQRTATAIGRRNFAVSGPETWNSLPAELRLLTLSMATFARLLKAHLFISTE